MSSKCLRVVRRNNIVARIIVVDILLTILVGERRDHPRAERTPVPLNALEVLYVKVLGVPLPEACIVQ